MIRGIVGILVLFAFFVALDVIVRATGSSQPAEKRYTAPAKRAPLTLGINRIAYVTDRLEIVTVDPDGSNPEEISGGGGRFLWPTWSPDGRMLAYSAVLGGGRDIQQVLFALDLASGETHELHAAERGLATMVAAETPHYVMWSPDSSHLAFLGATGKGLMLYLDDLSDGESPREAIDQAPLYFDWSPDSRLLLVHRGAGHYLIDVEDGVAEELPLGTKATGYRAPGWKPTGEKFAYISTDGFGGFGLYTYGVDARDRTLVGQVPPNAAFVWSPDAENIAATSPETAIFLPPLDLVLYQRVRIYGVDGTRGLPDIEENVVAFFWSPDSTKLAYVTLADEPGVFRWNILEVSDGHRRSLVDFRPSLGQLTILRYFDQYAYSHKLWSPDSSSLVFSGTLSDLGFSASFDETANERIVVVGTGIIPTVDVIAQGNLAVWSHR